MFLLGVILVFLLRHSNNFNRFIPRNISIITFIHNYLIQEIPSKGSINANVINNNLIIMVTLL